MSGINQPQEDREAGRIQPPHKPQGHPEHAAQELEEQGLDKFAEKAAEPKPHIEVERMDIVPDFDFFVVVRDKKYHFHVEFSNAKNIILTSKGRFIEGTEDFLALENATLARISMQTENKKSDMLLLSKRVEDRLKSEEGTKFLSEKIQQGSIAPMPLVKERVGKYKVSITGQTKAQPAFRETISEDDRKNVEYLNEYEEKQVRRLKEGKSALFIPKEIRILSPNSFSIAMNVPEQFSPGRALMRKFSELLDRYINAAKDALSQQGDVVEILREHDSKGYNLYLVQQIEPFLKKMKDAGVKFDFLESIEGNLPQAEKVAKALTPLQEKYNNIVEYLGGQEREKLVPDIEMAIGFVLAAKNLKEFSDSTNSLQELLGKKEYAGQFEELRNYVERLPEAVEEAKKIAA